MDMKCALVILLMTIKFVIGFIPKSDNYFEVLLDRFEMLYEDKNISETLIKVRKVNKTRSLVGSISLFQPCGNDLVFNIKLLKKQGGEYRYLPYRLPPASLCDAISKDTYCWHQIAADSDFPADVKNNCPFAAKKYTLNGVYCDLKNLPNIASSGDYAVETTYYKNDVMTHHIMVYGTVITA